MNNGLKESLEATYGKYLNKYKRYNLLSLAFYILLALLFMGAMSVMLLIVFDKIGDAVGRVCLIVFAALIVLDVIACKYFDHKSRVQLFLSAKCCEELYEVVEAEANTDTNETERCSVCGHEDVLLTRGSDGKLICDDCRSLYKKLKD